MNVQQIMVDVQKMQIVQIQLEVEIVYVMMDTKEMGQVVLVLLFHKKKKLSSE